MRFHLSHGVEHDTDNNQQARAAEKLRGDGWNVQSLAHKARQNRDQSKKNRAREREPRHGEIKKVGSRFPRPDAGNVTAVFLQIVGDLRGLKLGRDPKITEKENHPCENDVMGPAVGKRAGDLRSGRAVFKCKANDRGRKQQ